jgi:molybdopterin-guanine dinucleotide biosynthesis protein A
VETIPDLFPGADSLGGIATALAHARRTVGEDALVLCVACDMPFVEPNLLRALFELADDCDVDVPRTEAGYEPLCALYRARASDLFADRARRGELRIRDVFTLLPTVAVEESMLRRHDPALISFWNVNRPGDLEKAESLLRERPAGKSSAANG